MDSGGHCWGPCAQRHNGRVASNQQPDNRGAVFIKSTGKKSEPVRTAVNVTVIWKRASHPVIVFVLPIITGLIHARTRTILLCVMLSFTCGRADFVSASAAREVGFKATQGSLGMLHNFTIIQITEHFPNYTMYENHCDMKSQVRSVSEAL